MLIPSMNKTSALDRARDAGSNLVARVGNATVWAPIAFAMRSDLLRNRVLHSQLFRRRARHAILTKLGWTVLPVAGLALAYWGVRSFRRRSAEREHEENLQAARVHLPRGERNPPDDKVDESSWESFPASDPPSYS